MAKKLLFLLVLVFSLNACEVEKTKENKLENITLENEKI